MTGKPQWQPEEDERLRELYDKGLTCTEIANRFADGKSRNAIIGRIHRLGFERRGCKRVIGTVYHKTHIPNHFTPDEDDKLRALWPTTRPAAIAVELRRGRTAVSNRAHYLKLGPSFGARMARTPRKSNLLTIGSDFFRAKKLGEARAIASLPEPPPEPRGDKPDLMALKGDECKYPHGDPRHPDFHFCGLPVHADGHPYCQYHSRICFTPSQPSASAWRARPQFFGRRG